MDERAKTNIWQLQEAKARFSEFLDATLKHGPQIVTRRGVEAAVLVPIDEWRRLAASIKPTLKDILLAPEPRSDSFEAPRIKMRFRDPPTFD